MLAFIDHVCYNAIAGSVWSCSPRWLTISHRPTILACFGAATTRMCEDLSYRNIMNYADEIKSRLKMPEVLRYYGFYIKRGRIPCPIHHGDGWNCGVKDEYIHCFVCGATVDVVGFEMQYFNLDFMKSISKLNDDFRLGLPIGKKIDRRTQLEINKAAFERKRKQEERQKERQKVEDAYWAAFDEWKRLDDNKQNYAPKTPEDPLHPLFVEALQKIEYAEYKLECAEIARYEYEKRDSSDS